MNRKLRTRIPTISAKYTFCQHNAKKYKSIDAKIKERQKMNFDKRHRAKDRSSFVKKLPVWVNAPKTTQRKIVKSQSPRSVLVKTESGLLRKNKSHLRRRNDQTKFSQVAIPQELSTLPNVPREVPENSHDDSTYGNMNEQIDQPETQPTARSESSTNVESPQTRYTRRGRKIRPPKRLSL